MLTVIQQHIRPLTINQWAIRTDYLKDVLTNLHQDFQTITSNNIIDSNDAAKSMYEVCRTLKENSILSKLTDNGLDEHEFFFLFYNTLQFIFEKASLLNSTVGEREWKIYQVLCVLLKEFAPKSHDKKLNNKIIENAFFSKKFIATFKECIQQASTGSVPVRCQLLYDVSRHFYISSTHIQDRLRPHLLDPVLRCVLSDSYSDSFNYQDKDWSKFFREYCPSFIVANSENRVKEIVDLLCSRLLSYVDTAPVTHIKR